ncbi:hypothetical protein NX059_005764 [Plenodomus lindquistii]|nr:hypothetical protein NX059_005764 [Plenodomus lindquistii]
MNVLATLGLLRNLRVLRLRGIGLTDEDFAIVSRAIGTRVRSLDLSNNALTDASSQYLLDRCMKETFIQPHLSRGPLAPVDAGHDHDIMNHFESQDLVSHLRRTLTNGFIGSLAIEEARDVGVTHLFLARNFITVEGVSGLIRSGRLQVLDIGELSSPIVPPLEIAATRGADDTHLLAVSKLTPILSEHAKRLKYLRTNYRILTQDVSEDPLPILRAELNGDLGCYGTATAHELPVTEHPAVELDYASTSVFELPADSTYPTELPAYSNSRRIRGSPDRAPVGLERPISGVSEQAPTVNFTSNTLNVDARAANAPELVIADAQMTPTSPLFPSSGNGNSCTTFASHNQHECLLPTMAVMGADPEVTSAMRVGTRSRHNSTYYTDDRRARLDLRYSQENRLHPGMIPQVHTLVLTDVPTSTADGELIRRIVRFISDAAEEALIARQRARHTYILPPGRSRATAEREYARSLFALKRIVFELAPPETTQKKVSSSWRAYPTKSSTEDKDSEAFWEAAAHDFSFFGDEECGLPGLEPGQRLPLVAMSGLELAPTRAVPPFEAQPTMASAPMLDVVGEIGKFRKDRKATYNNLLTLGEFEPEVEGWWPGDITVVRNSAVADQGELDCFGNRYESGWYYR